MSKAIIVLAVVLLVGAALLFPFFQPSHEPRAIPVRISNVKQLATADFMYAGDCDGLLPPMGWRPVLSLYTKNPSLFEDRTEGRAYIFAHRASLIGTRLEEIPEPKNTVLFLDVAEASDPFVAELPALAFRGPPNDPYPQATVAFADGHGKTLSPGSAAKVR